MTSLTISSPIANQKTWTDAELMALLFELFQKLSF